MSSKEQTHSNDDKVSSKQRSPKTTTENFDIPARQQTYLATIIQRARLDLRSLSPPDVLLLQGIVGNQAVSWEFITRRPATPVELRTGDKGQALSYHPPSAQSQVQRALADRALVGIPPGAGVALTCHVATWYWAAQEAQARGLTTPKAPLRTLQRIAAMPGGPQGAMLALPRSGQWDFNIHPNTPPAGTVLLWTAGATHSAVVTAGGTIRGYNQVAQFAPNITDPGLTTGTPQDLGAVHRQCYTIAENDIVNAAGVILNL